MPDFYASASSELNANSEVMVIPGNEGAYRFWRSIIAKYTHHHFVEYTREILHFENTMKNIFKFDNKNTNVL